MQKCNVEPFEARRPVYFGYHIKVKQQNQSEKKQKKNESLKHYIGGCLLLSANCLLSTYF